FLGQLHPNLLARFVNRAFVEDGVRPAEVDVLENAALLHELLSKMPRVRDIPVMRDGKSAAGEVRIKRLHIAQAGAPCGRIAHVARTRPRSIARPRTSPATSPRT